MGRLILTGVAIVMLGAALGGCTRPRPAAGFVVPPGNADEGRKAFAELQCYTCHRVEGENFPGPIQEPAVNIGGMVLRRPSADEVAQDIMVPGSHFSIAYPAKTMAPTGRSEMPEYGKVVTIKQLSDLVSYIRSRYQVGLVAKQKP